jgi:hypothetical protein
MLIDKLFGLLFVNKVKAILNLGKENSFVFNTFIHFNVIYNNFK